MFRITHYSGGDMLCFSSLVSWLYNPFFFFISANIQLYIFTNPSTRAGYDTRLLFKQSLTGWNSEFSFLTSWLTKAEEFSLSNYLPIAGGRIIGFIPTSSYIKTVWHWWYSPGVNCYNFIFAILLLIWLLFSYWILLSFLSLFVIWIIPFT